MICNIWTLHYHFAYFFAYYAYIPLHIFSHYFAYLACLTIFQQATSILGRLALVPVGETGTILFSMRKEKTDCPGAACDLKKDAGDGNQWWYINRWAMKWATCQ